jgi:hypothetical protein
VEQDEHTQVALKKDADKVIDLSNKYIGVVIKNNDKVMEIIESNSPYIDREDIEFFNQFIVDYTRYKTEIDEEGRMVTPFMIYKRLGSEISFMRPQFIERVKQKYCAKIAELKSFQS